MWGRWGQIARFDCRQYPCQWNEPIKETNGNLGKKYAFFLSDYWLLQCCTFFKALHMALLLKGMQYFCPWYWQQGGEREKDVKDDIYCSVQIALGKVWPQIGTLLTNTKMYLRDNWGKTKLIFWSIWFFKKVLIAHEQSATFDISSSFWKASAWKGSCTIFLQIFYQLSFDI